MQPQTLDFAGGLRAVLKRREMTIAAFARLVGVEVKSLHNQLHRNNVLLSTVARFAFALDITPAELVKEAENAAAKKQVASAQVAR